MTRMHILVPIIVALSASCQNKPPLPVIDSYSRGGFLFASERISDSKIRTRVPCCQTYEADDDFRYNMVEAVQEFYGCSITDPVFTEDWVGAWQLVADCKVSPIAVQPFNSEQP